MATRKSLISRCQEAGVYCLDDGCTLEVVCRDGQRLASTGTHAASVNYRSAWGNRFMRIAEAYGSLLDDLADGVEPCEDPECDWCHDGTTIAEAYGEALQFDRIA